MTNDSWADLAKFLGLDNTDTKNAQEATYYICRKILSESIGKLSCKVLQKDHRAGIKERPDIPLYDTVKFRPNPYMTASTFWSTMESQCQNYGNAYAYIERKSNSSIQLWPLEYSTVQVWYDNVRLLQNVPDIYYFWASPEGRIPLTSTEVLHFKTSDTADGIMGKSVFDQLRATVDGAEQSQKMLNKLYRSGMTAKAVLNYTGDLSKENRDAFVAGIEQYAKGELKEKGIENIIPLPFGTTLTPLNVKLTDSQFLELKQYSALQIASAFGVKPSYIGDYTKASYASQESQQLSFYVDTLLFRLKHYEEELSYKLLTTEQRSSGLKIKFNEKAALRTDTKTQADILTMYVDHGLMSHNEARGELDLSAKEGGDILVISNGAAIPLSLLGAQYTNIKDIEGGQALAKQKGSILQSGSDNK